MRLAAQHSRQTLHGHRWTFGLSCIVGQLQPLYLPEARGEVTEALRDVSKLPDPRALGS